MEKFKHRPYYARMEFSTVQSEVEAMRQRGYSLKIVYEILSKDGRLTMAYATFCDYVRGGGVRLHRKKNEARKPDASEMLSEILEAIETRNDFGCNLKLVYQKLVERGLIGFGYADFCDYFRQAGAYLGRDIPDDFVFFEDDGLITFYYRLESLLKTELDKAALQNIQ